MATLPRTEHRVARSLADTLDPDEALARALAAIGEGLGWQLGQAWEPPPGKQDVLVCVESWCASGVDEREFVELSKSLTLTPGRGSPGPRLGERRGRMDRGRSGRGELPAGAGRAQRGAARRLLLPAAERARRARGGRVLHRRGARAGLRAARDDVDPRRSDRRRGGAPPRRRGTCAPSGPPSGDARRGARLRDQHRRRRPRDRVQPRRRADLRLHAPRRRSAATSPS